MSNQQGPTVEQYSSKVKEEKTATRVVIYEKYVYRRTSRKVAMLIKK